jgi:hypothetical protein
MFQPEQTQSDRSYWTSPSDIRSVRHQKQQKSVDCSEAEALLKDLVPDNLSPNKRAIIGQMLELWLVKAS